MLLFVAAQTGFLDGPRILANMALDRWTPGRFAALNDKLVTQNGILIMSAASIILMLYSAGSVRLLVVLYSINVFITFSLSQTGMVRHWWNKRHDKITWKKKLLVNGVGLILTSFILISVIVLKFNEGGWITIVITSSLILLVVIVKRQYKKTEKILKKLNKLTGIADRDEIPEYIKKAGVQKPAHVSGSSFNPSAKTAALFVNGFTGTGLQTLFTILKLFNNVFENYIFVQIGLLDSGTFKGRKEVENLENHIRNEVNRYVSYMQKQGYYSEGITATDIDLVDKAAVISARILKRFPDTVFFSGQLVFPANTFMNRWLHNYSSFALQRKFYELGIPIIIIPINMK